MKAPRTLFALAIALPLTVSVLPAAAYRYRDVLPHLPTTHLRQQTELREQHVTNPFVPNTRSVRSVAVQEESGRSYLSRGRTETRTALRNYHRHVLGHARGGYRVLNVAGDTRRKAMQVTRTSLPFSIVTTGGNAHNSHGSWGWDRVTRRDVRENSHTCVSTRDRDVLAEMRGTFCL